MDKLTYKLIEQMEKQIEALTAVLQELRKGHRGVREKSQVENLGLSSPSSRVT